MATEGDVEEAGFTASGLLSYSEVTPSTGGTVVFELSESWISSPPAEQAGRVRAAVSGLKKEVGAAMRAFMADFSEKVR